MFDNITDELLHKDSLAESEQVLGNKHWSEFNEKEQAFSLFKFMADNETKSEHLKSIGDTYWGMKWNEFINLIESYGFVSGLRYDFIAPKYGFSDEADRIEEAILYYHPTKGLILWATSYSGNINGGTVYGEINIDKERWKEISKALNRCSHGAFAHYNGETEQDEYKNQVEFDYDIREGLIHVLNRIENVTSYAPIWTERNFLWFLDYAEENQDGYDYRTITLEKILRCPNDLQDIVKVYLDKR